MSGTVIYSSQVIEGHVSVSATMIGGAGDDVLAGDNITYLVQGRDGNDTLTSLGGFLDGEAGDDSLHGSESDDVLWGGPGNDTVDGGAGFDLVKYADAYQGVAVDLQIAGPQQTGDGVDVLNRVEALGDSDFDDTLTGDGGANLLLGSGGDDVIYGQGGDDTITDDSAWVDDWGQQQSSPSADYLRGGDGNDQISGGDDSDDINGNQGNDTVHGGTGDDWTVGGKDDDSLSGDGGADLVLGNLGNDSCSGDAGADTVRGGQGGDSLAGGDGNDWLSGDLGDDTLSGGAGADVFHSFGGAGLDRVTDFNRAEGDRVQLDPGTTYSASQVGADVVITLIGGGQLVLAGVSMSGLTGDWIVASG